MMMMMEKQKNRERRRSRERRRKKRRSRIERRRRGRVKKKEKEAPAAYLLIKPDAGFFLVSSKGDLTLYFVFYFELSLQILFSSTLIEDSPSQ